MQLGQNRYYVMIDNKNNNQPEKKREKIKWGKKNQNENHFILFQWCKSSTSRRVEIRGRSSDSVVMLMVPISECVLFEDKSA